MNTQNQFSAKTNHKYAGKGRTAARKEAMEVIQTMKTTQNKTYHDLL